MQLFDLKNYQVTFSPQALCLIPFKKLWDRDKSTDKVKAIQELSYIWFMSDYKSDFSDILDPKERDVEVKKSCITIKDWEADKFVQEAMQFYKSRQETIASRMLEGALIYANKVDEWFRNVDLFEMDDKGKPVYDAKKGNDILKDLGKTVESLKQLQDVVRKERDISNKLRGNREKGMYVD